MNKRWLTACLLPLLFASVRADSIDDAEAKRRGVSLGQIAAEKALDAQKRKTEDAEKQAADLEKKIAEAQTRLSSGNFDSPIRPGAMTRPAMAAADPALPKRVEGPRKSSPAYDEIIDHYMNGDWTTLLADIGSKQGSIAAMPAANASDIAYIKAAIAECHPAWWDRTKAGNKMQFTTNIFGQDITYAFTNSPGGWTATAGVNQGKAYIAVGWPLQTIDSKNTFSFTDAEIPPISAGEFTWVEGGQLEVWQALGQKIPQLQAGLDKNDDLTPVQSLMLRYHFALMQKEVLFYYVSPKARRLEMSMIAYSATDQANKKGGWDGEHMILPWLLAELIGHRDCYPSVHLDGLQQFPDQPDGWPEHYVLTHGLADVLYATHLTFDEDCRLRESLWNYVLANGDPMTPTTMLDNGMKVGFEDFPKDSLTRYNWLRKQLASKSTSPSQPQP